MLMQLVLLLYIILYLENSENDMVNISDLFILICKTIFIVVHISQSNIKVNVFPPKCECFSTIVVTSTCCQIQQPNGRNQAMKN